MSPVMQTAVEKTALRPWYREPWPWILMSFPLAAVITGTITAVLAVRTSDGLVAEDYYKRGLAINRTLDHIERAKALGISASLSISGRAVRVLLRGAAPGAALRLRLIHPTLAGRDQSIGLRSVAPGVYEATLAPLDGQKREIILEDEAASWRITGTWSGTEGTTALSPEG
jgi:hypothetical protein